MLMGKKRKMEIQTFAGTQKFDQYKNLVLYLDLPSLPELREDGRHMAAVYEATQTDSLSDEIPILLCSGNGFQEWQATLTLITVLFIKYHGEEFKNEVEGWYIAAS